MDAVEDVPASASGVLDLEAVEVIEELTDLAAPPGSQGAEGSGMLAGQPAMVSESTF